MENEAFDIAISFLPPGLYKLLSEIPENIKATVYEIRLRTEKPIVLVTSKGTLFLDETGRVTYMLNFNLYKVSGLQMKEAFNRLCNFSVYSYSDNISQGFITLASGHRVGLGGTAVTENGRVVSMRNVNSLNIRIAREFKGCANIILQDVFQNELRNVIIAGPPSSGKTTLLRDIARQISLGKFGCFHKVAIIDERCEISPVSDGVCFQDTGPNTDVLSSFKKSDGIMLALRTLSPEIIICDEIGTIDECEAIKSGINSGVNFVLSIHASTKQELMNKIQLKTLVESGFTAQAVMLKSTPCEILETFKVGELQNENDSSLYSCCICSADRSVSKL